MAGNTVLKWSDRITTLQVVQLIRAEKNLQKALFVFDLATAEYPNGFRHNHETFGLMISKLASAKQFKSAEDLLKRMKEENCGITEDVFLSICRGYGRVHRPFDVIRIFQLMNEYHCRLTEKSFVTVFSILVDENQLKLAMRFYRYMRKLGMPPTVVSLNVLIKALCKNTETVDAAFKIFREMPVHGCDPDVITYGTLISGLCKFGRIEEACQLLKEMEEKRCLPTVVTYTCLIHGLCQSDKVDEAVLLFKEMTSKGIKANVFTYSSLMDGLCKAGCSTQAIKLLEMMTGKALSPNMITYSTLIHGLHIEGKVQEALEIFDRMKLQGLKPDAGLYSKIIYGLCENGKFQQAANYVDEMVLVGVQPSRLTWGLHVKMHNMVVRGLCFEGDHVRAFNLYLSMRTRGLSTEPETFDLLGRCLCLKNDFKKSVRVVDELIIDGYIPSEAFWTDLLNKVCDERTRHEAAEALQVHINAYISDLRAID